MFVCWRSLLENAWAFAPLAAAKPFLPPLDPPDPLAPGPFAFADGKRVRGILADARVQGYSDRKTGYDHGHGRVDIQDASVEALNIGPAARAVAEFNEAAREEVRVAIADALTKFKTLQGITPPAACWLVRATG